MKNKIVIVTGASTGIGRAIAIELGKNNATVYLVARSENKLQDTKRLVEEAGGKAKIFLSDFSNIESVNQFIAQVKTGGRVDVLVNVAGVWHGKDEVYANKDFESFSQKTIIDTYNVGTITPTLLAHAFIPLMKNNGKIINVSGTFENGAKGWLPYCVSKKAIEDLTIGLSEELNEKNIQVNCISPSDVATEEYGKYFPQYMNEAIEPEKIAKFAAYLCSEEADSITGKVYVLKKDIEPYVGFHS